MLSPRDAAPQQRPEAAVCWLAPAADSPHDYWLPYPAFDRGPLMKIHAPSETLYWIAVALLFLALFGHFVPDMSFLNQYHFWISVTASAVLMIGCVI
jgi:hypothetical protein